MTTSLTLGMPFKPLWPSDAQALVYVGWAVQPALCSFQAADSPDQEVHGEIPVEEGNQGRADDGAGDETLRQTGREKPIQFSWGEQIQLVLRSNQELF